MNGNEGEGEEGGENNTGSVVDRFEESFINCLNAMLKNDSLNHFDRDETRVDVEQGLNHLIDSARDLEAYFLRKRVNIATQKPELVIRDESSELKNELMRKDELIKKNFDKTMHWQTALADLQSVTTVNNASTAGSQGQSPAALTGPSTPRPVTPIVSSPGSARMQSPAHMTGFQQQSSGLQGPLAYLEKASTTIGLNLNDGRP